ncbi:hypothetical protein FACS1894172_04640 [Spirochaetia bacterium]|nr:hypothetical protein FACS1894164_12680 [Spirochaetia bacterium]GHU30798.1 hypothetical protein FACS1894172_04640 [Spirochaetia bacterium]
MKHTLLLSLLVIAAFGCTTQSPSLQVELPDSSSVTPAESTTVKETESARSAPVTGTANRVQGAAYSYYVSATGSDSNSGNTEDRPFKTLKRALIAARQDSTIKLITVLGQLDAGSEDPASDSPSVFVISDTDLELITIAGKADESATLSGTESGKTVIEIGYGARIQFENIIISGGESENNTGGLIVSGGQVILGSGAEISGNKSHSVSGGVAVVRQGSLVMQDGSLVKNNVGNSFGGIYADGKSRVALAGGTLGENQTQSVGGGIGIIGGSSVTLSGTTISANTGGAVFVSKDSTLTITGGMVTGHLKALSGTIIVNGTLTMENGEISANEGSGIRVAQGGTATMTGGSISGNRDYFSGAGVSVAGTFIFENGTISDNLGNGMYIADTGTVIMNSGLIQGNRNYFLGGGVSVAGTFKLNGGTIIGNEASAGGGISAARRSTLFIGESETPVSPATWELVTRDASNVAVIGNLATIGKSGDIYWE